MRTPIVALIGDSTALPNKYMVLAGATELGDKGTFRVKREALEATGATTASDPAPDANMGC